MTYVTFKLSELRCELYDKAGQSLTKKLSIFKLEINTIFVVVTQKTVQPDDKSDIIDKVSEHVSEFRKPYE